MPMQELIAAGGSLSSMSADSQTTSRERPKLSEAALERRALVKRLIAEAAKRWPGDWPRQQAYIRSKVVMQSEIGQ